VWKLSRILFTQDEARGKVSLYGALEAIEDVGCRFSMKMAEVLVERFGYESGRNMSDGSKVRF
jgi:hypothetical protein